MSVSSIRLEVWVPHTRVPAILAVILHQTPLNTGNIIWLCANTGTRLHLVKPLGVTLVDYAAGDAFVFGLESRGLPGEIWGVASNSVPASPWSQGTGAAIFLPLWRWWSTKPAAGWFRNACLTPPAVIPFRHPLWR